MRIGSLFSIAVCSCSIVGLASGLKRPGQPQAHTTSTSSAGEAALLKLRGGAGPLDPTLVAKTATAILTTQGLANVLCTDASLEAYGIPSASDDDVIATKFLGATQFASALAPVLLLFYGTDVNTALAYALVPHILWFVTGLINETPAKFGIDSFSNKLWAVIDSAILYGLWKKTDWSTNALKAELALAGLTYGMLRVNPVKFMEQSGRTKPVAPLTAASLRETASTGLAATVQFYALLTGTDTLTAIGYAWAVSAVGLSYNLFVSNMFEELKVDKGPFYAWLGLSLVIVGTLNL